MGSVWGADELGHHTEMVFDCERLGEEIGKLEGSRDVDDFELALTDPVT